MTASRFQSTRICRLACLLGLVAFGGAPWTSPTRVHAESIFDQLPSAASGIAVVDQVGKDIPLDLLFKDDRGRVVKLEQFFKNAGGKPIVLTMNYSDCPGLCIAQLENLVETLRAMDAKGLGDDYEIVTISIDPREDSPKAARTKSKYTGLLRGTKAESSWHFLVGEQPAISSLAKSLGYYYTYDRANDRFNHPAVTYFISSDGRICRYFVDLGIEPSQFRLAVAEASEGKLTRSLADAFVQFCYYYDPEANRYSASARRLLTLGFAAFVVLAFGCLVPFWFGGKAKNVVIATSNETVTEAPQAADKETLN